ncbi:enoyl-CoA hydratase/isomerase family protein [Chloroflexota bacterium]
MAVDYTIEGKIGIFTINRPEAYNAVNIQVLQELSEAMISFRDDPDVWVGILTGSGKAFCAGADIGEMLPFAKDHPDKVPPTHMRGLEIWKPLIAGINGIALGGGLELALACDIRVISERAKLGVPEVTLGIIPGWGGTQRLPKLIPDCLAAELLFTGKPIGAEEAYRIGLVNAVVPPEEVMNKAREYAEAILAVGPLAARAAKQSMIQGIGKSLTEGLAVENELFAYLLRTQDHAEGRAAFENKRKAEFQAK